MKSIYVLFVFLLTAVNCFSQEFPARPSPPRLVNDFTGTLTSDEKTALEQKLVAYNDSTSTQIAVVMLRSLDGYPIDDYAFKLAENWGIGQKGVNNGVLVLVATDDHKIFIATGYGMEGVMPDGLVKRIIEEDIKPAFRNGDYYGGLDKGTDSMFRLAAGEYKSSGKSGENDAPVPVLMIIIIIFFVVMGFVFRIRSVQKYSIVNNIGFWAAWALLNQAGRSHRGSWGGFSGGGGWGGGGGGGGFGGFGGGSFGGGGAGGSW